MEASEDCERLKDGYKILCKIAKFENFHNKRIAFNLIGERNRFNAVKSNGKYQKW